MILHKYLLILITYFLHHISSAQCESEASIAPNLFIWINKSDCLSPPILNIFLSYLPLISQRTSFDIDKLVIPPVLVFWVNHLLLMFCTGMGGCCPVQPPRWWWWYWSQCSLHFQQSGPQSLINFYHFSEWKANTHTNIDCAKEGILR